MRCNRGAVVPSSLCSQAKGDRGDVGRVTERLSEEAIRGRDSSSDGVSSGSNMRSMPAAKFPFKPDATTLKLS